MPRVYKTLEQLRQDVAARCGFGGSAAASSVIAPLLNSIIDSAQQWIYQEMNHNTLVKFANKTVGYGQNEVDYPADCDPDRVQEISVNDGGFWTPLERGIDTRHRSYMDDFGVPCRWEMLDVIEMYPKADQVYDIRIKYVASTPRLTQDKDRVVIDDQLVFLLALHNAKLHYRHPDANAIGEQFKRMLNNVKARSRSKVVHRRDAMHDNFDDMYSRPVRD